MAFYLSPDKASLIIDFSAIILALLIIVFVFLKTKDKMSRYVTTFVCGGIMIIFGVLTIMSYSSKVDVGKDEIRINLPPYAKESIKKDEIVKAYVAYIDSNKNVKLTFKENGAATSKYKVGRFTLANGKRAVVMTARSKVLVLETNEKSYLLSPNDYEEFVRTINENIIKVQE